MALQVLYNFSKNNMITERRGYYGIIQWVQGYHLEYITFSVALLKCEKFNTEINWHFPAT
jgi:hypothetical protein